MTVEIIRKDAFYVIGKAGKGKSTEGPKWIPPLWEDANGHFDEISDLVCRDADGKPLVWGAMSDPDGRFLPWNEYGLYLAGCEVPMGTVPMGTVPIGAAIPDGWTVWHVPFHTYAVAACKMNDYGETFSAMLSQWIPQNGYRLAGAVHEFYPEPGGAALRLYFPIERQEG